MSNEHESKPADPVPEEKRGRFPKKTIGLTIIVLAIIALSKIFASEVVDVVGLSPDLMNVSSYALVFLVFLMWAVWMLFVSGRRWYVRILMLVLLFGLPYAFLSVMRPVMNGDAGIARFEPIWTPKTVVNADVETSSLPVDLKTETPNDFAEFLGPNRNGVVRDEPKLRDDAISSDTEIVWKQEIGEGWSGFAARNGYAVTMEQRGELECVTCYEIESGELQWLYKHRARHRDPMGLGRVGPRATPTIDGGYVYAIGALGNLVCLNGADGIPIWQHDLLKMLEIDLLTGEIDNFEFQYENSALAWGRAGSPLIVDDMVVVTGGGPRGLAAPGETSEDSAVTLLAFEKTTGELRWKAGTEMIAYGSPSLATLAGRRQIVVVAESKALGFDATTGEQLWEHARPGTSDADANCSQVNVLSDDTILLTKGYNAGGELVTINYEDGKFEANSIESNPAVLKTKLTSPIVYEGHAYSLSDGFLECTDISDLSRKWKRRGRFGHGQMLLCGDKLLVHGERGTLSCVRATPDGYEELGSMETIDGVCWNTLCRYGEYLLVRSELEAACIRLGVETAD